MKKLEEMQMAQSDQASINEWNKWAAEHTPSNIPEFDGEMSFIASPLKPKTVLLYNRWLHEQNFCTSAENVRHFARLFDASKLYRYTRSVSPNMIRHMSNQFKPRSIKDMVHKYARLLELGKEYMVQDNMSNCYGFAVLNMLSPLKNFPFVSYRNLEFYYALGQKEVPVFTDEELKKTFLYEMDYMGFKATQISLEESKIYPSGDSFYNVALARLNGEEGFHFFRQLENGSWIGKTGYNEEYLWNRELLDNHWIDQNVMVVSGIFRIEHAKYASVELEEFVKWQENEKI